MFVFDNLADIGDRDLQLVLREVPNDGLSLALRGATPRVRDKITRNMSQRAAQILLEDMEARGPVRCPTWKARRRKSSPPSAAWPTRARFRPAAPARS
jgi:flagellar motor switch protein FliG